MRPRWLREGKFALDFRDIETGKILSISGVIGRRNSLLIMPAIAIAALIGIGLVSTKIALNSG